MSQEIKETIEHLTKNVVFWDNFGGKIAQIPRADYDQALAKLRTEQEQTIKVFDEIEMDAKRIFENVQANLKEYRRLKNSDSKPENTLAGGYLVYAEKYCLWGVKLTQGESTAPEPKCKTCGDTKKTPTPQSIGFGIQNAIMQECPDCKAPEQPPAGDFTKKVRKDWDKNIFGGVIFDLCDIIDRSEASREALLAACERYIAYRKGADDSIDAIAPQIEAAIAKALKE